MAYILLSTLPDGVLQDIYGNARAGVHVYVYAPGTTTQVPIYCDPAGAVPLVQPIVSDATGGLVAYVASDQVVDLFDAAVQARVSVQVLAVADLGARGVISFNMRNGTVTLSKADVTGTGLAATDIGADVSGAAATAQAASLQKTSNLSDIASGSTARTNLGLGTAATHASGDFDSAGAAAAAQAASDPSGSAATAQANAIAASAQALVPTAVKTSAYTAAAGDFVPVDISGGSVTVTLPNAPADKTRIGVKVVNVSGTPGSTTCTVARAGADVFNVAAGSTSLTLTALFQGVLLQYSHSAAIWYVSTADTPVGVALGAAKLGSDGTVGGPGGTGLTGSVVTASSGAAVMPFIVVSGIDSAAIQAAINALPSSGGIVFLQGATYTLSTTITFPNSNIILQGTGESATVIVAGADVILFDISGSGTSTSGSTHLHKISLRDMTIDGGNNASWNTQPMIRSYYADTCWFENVNFRYKYGIAWQAVEFWDSRFMNCRWDSCGGNTGLQPTVAGAVNGKPAVLLLNQDNTPNTGFGGSNNNTNEIHFIDCVWETCRDGSLWALGDAYGNTAAVGPIVLCHPKFDTISSANGPYFIASNGLQVYLDSISVSLNGAGSGWNSTPFDLFIFRKTLDFNIGGTIKATGSTVVARTGVRLDGTVGSGNTSGTVGDVRGQASVGAGFSVGLVEYAGTNNLVRRVGQSFWQNGASSVLEVGSPTSAPANTPTTPNVQVFSNVTTLSGAGLPLSVGGGAITRIPVAALQMALAINTSVVLTSGANTQTWVLSAAAAAGATTLTVYSQTPSFAFPSGSTVVPLTTTLASTLSSLLSTGAPITSLPIAASTIALASGTLTLQSGTNSQTWTLNGALAAGDTTITVNSQTPGFAYPAGSPLLLTVASPTAVWTKPAAVTTVRVQAIAAGGGGSSGGVQASGVAAIAGNGGGGAGYTDVQLAAAELTPTITVTAAAGGAGGTAVTANSSASNPGVAGNASGFGAFGQATGGGGGGVGNSQPGGGGGGVTQPGGAGAGASGTGLVGTNATSSGMTGGGGSGGGITTGNAVSNGAKGASGSVGQASAGALGNGAAGGNGANFSDANLPFGGGAGGGGASALAGGFPGGNGGTFGAGGGGGGAAQNAGSGSGRGGNGSPGIVVVTAW